MSEVLFRLAGDGNIVAVARLLKDGADVHEYNDEALQVASYKGHLDVVKLLLKYGADVHAYNDFSLQSASAQGHMSIVDLLIKSGADIHAENNKSLQRAVEKGLLDMVGLLLKSGADIHARGDLALLFAANNNQKAMVRRLILAGADLTALHRSSLNKNELTDILKKRSPTAYRSMNAVMMLDAESRMDVLCYIHPDLEPKQTHEELALMQALGLDAAQMAEMWQARHGLSTQKIDMEVSL